MDSNSETEPTWQTDAFDGLIRAGAEQLQVPLTERQIEQIARFCRLLGIYNRHTNLVSDASENVLVRDHVLDSLSLIPSIVNRREQAASVGQLVDIGSGAGFPGMILALALEDLAVTLVESVNKKARFLEQVVDALGLIPRVEVIVARAEELAHQAQYRYRFDWATARAVGPLSMVCELAAPFVGSKGAVLVQKSVKQSLEDVPKERVFKALGLKLNKTVSLNQEILGKERALIIFERLEPAPKRYPRSWKQIKSSPLA
jgi:16S rRNA (guanine527-N7)-methyltransferase